MQLISRLSFLCLLLISIAAHAQVLDKTTIEKMLVEIDQLAAKKDVAGMQRFISPDAKLTISTTSGGQTQTLSMSRSEYIEAGKQGLAAVTDYRTQRSDTKIEIVANGKKAIIRHKTTESMKMQGQRVSGTSFSTTTVELMNGVPLITAVTANVNMQ